MAKASTSHGSQEIWWHRNLALKNPARCNKGVQGCGYPWLFHRTVGDDPKLVIGLGQADGVTCGECFLRRAKGVVELVGPCDGFGRGASGEMGP